MRTPSLHLKPFAPSPQSSLELRVDVRHRADLIEFEFLLAGSSLDLDRILWPPAKVPQKRERRDELWKSTCLELFLASPTDPGYIEMNVSPSGDWAAYAFDRYREGMRPASGTVTIHVAPPTAEPYFRLVGSLRAAGAGDVEGLLSSRSDLVFAATAVLEYRNGEREYWALEHAGEKPDFHLRASFTGRLQRPS